MDKTPFDENQIDRSPDIPDNINFVEERAELSHYILANCSDSPLSKRSYQSLHAVCAEVRSDSCQSDIPEVSLEKEESSRGSPDKEFMRTMNSDMTVNLFN